MRQISDGLTKLITLATVDLPRRKSKIRLSSESATRFEREVCFLEIPEFSYDTVQDKSRVACISKTNSIRSTVSTTYRRVTDRHRAAAYTALCMRRAVKTHRGLCEFTLRSGLRSRRRHSTHPNPSSRCLSVVVRRDTAIIPPRPPFNSLFFYKSQVIPASAERARL